MKKIILLFSLFLFVGCAGNIKGIKESYNVNIYDANGEWYETGLLIESFDNRIFVKTDDGRFELLKSDKEDFRYMIESAGEIFYVK